MSDSQDNAAAGDAMGALLLGFAGQLDQLAALIGGTGAAEDLFGAGSSLNGLVGELGTLAGELGSLLSRLLDVLIAILEAVSDMLGSGGGKTAAAPATAFQSIPVRIGPVAAHS
ncbi:hypothetical protein GOHSU_01_00290 [Gordonia hirsuta DSM 44140 = NBRC 16056]|uniref:Uncharacterized protein n=1 Tax=Gordonia hirsuta DSM 44140 = NBRC 16056 TaxID=1121927 RepID=L7L3X6_9ACTN|nr:hypothetical protein [Gordonia hirsuta]GAC55850.1 hypothetical protein GOHSU_01_00290 [Gordonia hirsuta DSM 44140 = NBRC 16056]